MISTIFILEEGDPDIKKVAEYSKEPKQALICWLQQNICHNYNTWQYPEEMIGMRESDTLPDHWYFDLFKSRGDSMNAVVCAYPADTPLSCKPVFGRKRA